MIKGKLSILLATVSILALSTSIVNAKASAIVTLGKDSKSYEYNYEDLKTSATASVLGDSVNSALYKHFLENQTSIQAYYDDVRNAYVSSSVVSQEATNSILNGKAFDFNKFLEDTNTPTIDESTTKITKDNLSNNDSGNTSDVNKNYTFTSEKDLSKSGYSDILGGEVNINETLIRVKIDLRQLPEELIFNKYNVEMNAGEYHWGMRITDKNDTYEIAAAHWKLESQQKTLPMLEGLQRDIWKINSSGGFNRIKECNLEKQDNSIILSGNIDDLDVNSISKITIQVSNLSLNKSGYDYDNVLVIGKQ